MALLEVCAGDIGSVKAASTGGAARVELCSALEVGGITPSDGFITEALKVGGVKVHVLIRPRNGDFLYDDDEIECMARDVKIARELGAHGVVIGALTTDGNVDIEACKRILRHADSMNVTFHRAFDLCRDPFKAIDEICSLGCNRILTSGQAPSAEAGVELLSKLNDYAHGRLKILAGGGINPSNAAKIIQATGISEVHASARSKMPSKMQYRRDGVAMGAPDSDEYSRATTSAEIVKRIVESITI